VGGAPEDFGIHPMKNRTDDYAGGHEDDDVGDAGEADEAVSDECENEQAAQEGEKEIQIHLTTGWIGMEEGLWKAKNEANEMWAAQNYGRNLMADRRKKTCGFRSAK
jgi:hypothetical protein